MESLQSTLMNYLTQVPDFRHARATLCLALSVSPCGRCGDGGAMDGADHGGLGL